MYKKPVWLAFTILFLFTAMCVGTFFSPGTALADGWDPNPASPPPDPLPDVPRDQCPSMKVPICPSENPDGNPQSSYPVTITGHSVTRTTITLFWKSKTFYDTYLLRWGNGSAADPQIDVKPSPWMVGGVSRNAYALTGLAPGRWYTIQVRGCVIVPAAWAFGSKHDCSMDDWATIQLSTDYFRLQLAPTPPMVLHAPRARHIIFARPSILDSSNPPITHGTTPAYVHVHGG